MAKSDLMATLRRAYSIAQTSIKTGIPADELLDKAIDRTLENRVSRRRLLHSGLAAAGAIAATTFTRDGNRAVAQETGRSPILIVGGGIAGLTAAYRLRQAGIRTDIVEATNRPGGRIRTLPKVGGTIISAELGGEFISTSHTSLISLATELGLMAIDLKQVQERFVDNTFYFQGRRVTLAQLTTDFAPLAQKIAADLTAIGDTLSYKSANETAESLDNTSLAEYLDNAETSTIIRQLLRIAYIAEYGRDAEEQSCLNMLFLIGTETNNFSVTGNNDERYQIEGGNEKIIQGLTNLVADSIETATILEAVNTLSDGRYRVSLRSGQSAFDRTYERILFALPFTTLRQVQLNVNLSREKLFAINNLGYGTNSKLITAYKSRVWREFYRSTAAVYSDLGFQTTWEPTPFAPTGNGLVTELLGGRQGLALGSGTPEDQAQRFVSQFDKVFPGVKDARIGNAVRAFWPGERFVQGSYACYLVGQWTRMYGVEGERAGNLYFAGEHTSLENQGYMEGGCETGERAAVEILEDLGLSSSAQSLSQRRATNLNSPRPSRRVPRNRNSSKSKQSIR
ncbi:NAD(P)/FAD-dependent oxidoreductase [Kamptonema sp. UHCC 0994]|uniref:flavin monoamine oxidase family protein n=1 Tax=Kamptonema sp. UHCC 0994 TaxID=3031329 RepID=UPI0023BB0FB3|nr:NAD(P)/FAD-dependent oxidoreductase [Kamptonema sp. UHCC 0994]MDF0556636.1 NAD(P)/FAD-dependent oxidoreductase [Kamptonema sp. UHCC 0994]